MPGNQSLEPFDIQDTANEGQRGPTSSGSGSKRKKSSESEGTKSSNSSDDSNSLEKVRRSRRKKLRRPKSKPILEMSSSSSSPEDSDIDYNPKVPEKVLRDRMKKTQDEKNRRASDKALSEDLAIIEASNGDEVDRPPGPLQKAREESQRRKERLLRNLDSVNENTEPDEFLRTLFPDYQRGKKSKQH